MGVPILTYHSMNIAGDDYAHNDHVALAEDLRAIDSAGFRILPLHEIVVKWLRSPDCWDGERAVALTCDDGADFDFHDLPHPVAGMQRSMLNTLLDFARDNPSGQPGTFITSFAIISPSARKTLDRTCMIGRGWWNDDWWLQAVRTGLMGVGNHSWDHNHETLPEGDFPGVARGTFRSIDDERLADFQIRQAQEYLRHTAPNPSDSLFAYPYGESNAFLVEEYFPKEGAALGIHAAVGDRPEPMTRASSRWNLPRYVYPRDWKSPAEMQRLLREAAKG